MLRRALVALAVLVVLVGLGAGVVYVFGYELARIALGLPPYTHAFGERRDFRVETDDGIGLATQVYLPEGPGPWPTLLMRGPYNAFNAFGRLCEIFARYGYTCVHQDVRGRFGSEGEWRPLIHERDDGLDTLEWLVAQPWQDGHIALYGPSYLAMVQWVVGDALPPEVKTLIPMVSHTNLYEAAYRDGMFKHEVFTAWAALMPGREMNTDNGEAYQRAIRHWPLIEADERFFGARLDWFRDWIRNSAPGDPFWNTEELRRLRSMPGRVSVPVLMIGGWYDIFLAGQLEAFRSLASRDRSRLVIGPWTHVQATAGDLEYPDEGGRGLQWRMVLEWLGHHLRGEPLPGSYRRVATYAIGEGRWIERDGWPPPTRDRILHLGDAGNAATCAGGHLSERRPQATESVSYRYDPRDPAPGRGGSQTLAFVFRSFDGVAPGSVAQEGLCERADVLTFQSDPLPEDLHLAGAVDVRLTVSSDARDTAFTAKLIEVSAEGRAVNIRDTITTLAYRNGSRTAQPYAPGELTEIRLEMAPIEWRVPAGARLRLDVSSSNFPVYHAHPNRAGPWALERDPVVAEQTLHVGGEHVARVTLRVWEGEAP